LAFHRRKTINNKKGNKKMSRQNINNSDLLSASNAKLNDNFIELYGWTELTVTKASGVGGTMQAWLNKALKLLHIRLATVTLPNGNIGQQLGQITFPVGYAFTSSGDTRRFTVVIDLASNAGRMTGNIDLREASNNVSPLLLYPVVANQHDGTVPGLSGSTLYGDGLVRLP
jgi:hypothetical protein